MSSVDLVQLQKQLGPLTKEFGSGAEESFPFPIDGVIGTDDEVCRGGYKEGERLA